MTAQMQEVVERVQSLPEWKRYEVLDVISRLLSVVSAKEDSNKDEIVAYVETDLTDEEIAAMEEARKEHEANPEGTISLADYFKQRGITKEDLAKRPPVRFVYR